MIGETEEAIDVDFGELMAKLRESEVSWPNAGNYSQENPLLFRFILSRGKAFEIGATIVYQLKKAQFESRKLSRMMKVSIGES